MKNVTNPNWEAAMCHKASSRHKYKMILVTKIILGHHWWCHSLGHRNWLCHRHCDIISDAKLSNCALCMPIEQAKPPAAKLRARMRSRRAFRADTLVILQLLITVTSSYCITLSSAGTFKLLSGYARLLCCQNLISFFVLGRQRNNNYAVLLIVDSSCNVNYCSNKVDSVLKWDLNRLYVTFQKGGSESNIVM